MVYKTYRHTFCVSKNITLIICITLSIEEVVIHNSFSVISFAVLSDVEITAALESRLLNSLDELTPRMAVSMHLK